MNPDDIKSLQALISQHPPTIIVTHVNPDGDAIGSSLGLFHYLVGLGVEVTLVVPNHYPDFLAWMPGENRILNFFYKAPIVKKKIAEAGLIFCLDFNALSRINDLGEIIRVAPATKVMIDHHIAPESFADIMFSDVIASSTSELVYEVIEELGDEEKISYESAVCLYTGILTDTGGFQFPATSAKVHRIVARLIEKGVQVQEVSQLVFNSFTAERLQLFGHCLNEKMKLYPEYHSASLYITVEEVKRFNVQTGDTEGLVNYPLKIKSVNFSAFFSEKGDIVKISFRSKGRFDVNEFARKHFNGGGHRNAAGGQSKLSVTDTLKYFESLLPEYKDSLNY